MKWRFLALGLVTAVALLLSNAGCSSSSAERKRILSLLPAAERENEPWRETSVTPATDRIVACGKEAVPALLQALTMPNPPCSEYTVYTILGRLGPLAVGAVQELKARALAKGGTVEAMAVFQTLELIIPGDPQLLTLAGKLAEQGRIEAAQWLARQGKAGQPELLRLVQHSAAPPLGLLECYTDSGAPLQEISAHLLRALAPEDPAQMNRLSDDAQGKLLADNNWAEKALNKRPAERPGILTAWSGHYGDLNDGARAYLVGHVAELNIDQAAILEQAVKDKSYLVWQAACRAIPGSRVDQSKGLQLLLENIEREPYSNAPYALARYGQAGLEQLHRLALQDRLNTSSLSAQVIWLEAAAFGPQVLGILYDIYRHGKGGARYEALHGLSLVAAFPEDYRKLMLQVGREIGTAPEADQVPMMYLYVTGVYGSGPGPQKEGEDVEQIEWLKQASLRDDNEAVRRLAHAELARMRPGSGPG